MWYDCCQYLVDVDVNTVVAVLSDFSWSSLFFGS